MARRARRRGARSASSRPIRWHRRDREELAERYQRVASHAWNFIPHGVEPRPLRGAGETLFWLPGVATLVAGDRLVGARTHSTTGAEIQLDEDGEGGGAAAVQRLACVRRAGWRMCARTALASRG